LDWIRWQSEAGGLDWLVGLRRTGLSGVFSMYRSSLHRLRINNLWRLQAVTSTVMAMMDASCCELASHVTGGYIKSLATGRHRYQSPR
jgi:hypothetical protein